MRVLAVDDESVMLERLVDCIRQVLSDAEIYDFRAPSKALEFASQVSVDIAFLDIQMRGMDGITLGAKLRAIQPNLNVIYITAYAEHAFDAYQLNASGYLLKPIDPEELRRQIQCLRYPIPRQKRVVFQCFGNFDAFADGRRIAFKYERTRELLAYLVDRCGAGCTADEIMAALWEDEVHASYFQNLRKDLQDTLRRLGCEEILDKGRGTLAIRPELVDCDYYRWKDGHSTEAYRGEYMTQYSWAEKTNGALSSER